jgi:hypothetical protein
VGGETLLRTEDPHAGTRETAGEDSGISARAAISTRSSSSLTPRHDIPPAGMPRIRVLPGSKDRSLEVANSRGTRQDKQAPGTP